MRANVLDRSLAEPAAHHWFVVLGPSQSRPTRSASLTSPAPRSREGGGRNPMLDEIDLDGMRTPPQRRAPCPALASAAARHPRVPSACPPEALLWPDLRQVSRAQCLPTPECPTADRRDCSLRSTTTSMRSALPSLPESSVVRTFHVLPRGCRASWPGRNPRTSAPKDEHARIHVPARHHSDSRDHLTNKSVR